jgi:hypothetical protein
MPLHLGLKYPQSTRYKVYFSTFTLLSFYASKFEKALGFIAHYRLVRYDLDSIFCFVCGVIDVEMLGFVWVMDVRLSFSHLSFCIF